MKNIKNTLHYSVIIGLFLVPFIPFIVPTGTFFPFIAGKGFAFRILVEILFGFYAILAIAEPAYRPKLSWITKTVVGFALIIFIADLFGANISKSLWSNYERMEGFVLIFHLVLYYIVASSMFRTAKQWIRFFNISVVASFLMSLYSAAQIYCNTDGKIGCAVKSASGQIEYWFKINQGGVRVDGLFGNATYLAIYLVFHIFLCVYLSLQPHLAKWQKWAYGVIAACECIILYFTATRGAILGLIGGLILSGLILVWKEKENKKIRKIAKWTLGIITGFILVFLAVQNTTFVKNSPVLSRFSQLGVSEFQTQGRYFVWPMAIKGFVQSPKTFLIGWGQENFNFVFNKYYDPRMFGQEEWFDRTHNIVLDWLIAGGLAGLLAYLSMHIALLYYLWRKESSLTLAEKSVLTGMIAAYVFHNIFVFDNLISYILFFSVLGYIHTVSVSQHPVSASSKRFSNTIQMFVVLPGILLVTILGVYFINIPALRANWTLIEAIQQQSKGPDENLALFQKAYGYNSFGSTEITEQLISLVIQLPSAQVSNDIKQKFYDFAKSKIEEKIKQTPHDARYLVFAGNFFNQFSQYDLAILYLEKAIVESPNKQSIYFTLGSSYLGKGDRTKAFESFKRAYDLEPTAKESQIIYAIGALYTRNTAVLQEMTPLIDNATVVSDNRFLKAYADLGEWNTVITILNARIVNNPSDTQSRLSLASVYVTIGQKQKAIDVINGTIKDNPSFKEQGEGYIKQIQSS